MHRTFKRINSRETREQGFTLIELLVVIAIIGILAAIILVSLSSARTKGANAEVENQLDDVRSAMELYATTNTTNPNSYAGACTNAGVDSELKGADSASGNSSTLDLTGAIQTGIGNEAFCYANSAGWMVQAPLQGDAGTTYSGGYWCVDSTGNSKLEAAQITTAGSPTSETCT